MTALLACLAMLPTDKTVNDLQWMVGSWSADVDGGQFHETWLEPAGATMQGCGRLIKDSKTAFMEFMSIESTNRGLAMFMVLGNPASKVSPPVPFYLKSMIGKSAVWERDEKNNFPKRIVYTGNSDGTLFCRIEDDRQHQDFTFTKR